MFRVERSQISNENTGGSFSVWGKLNWTKLKIYKVEYISKLAYFVFRCVKLIFGLLRLPTGAVVERGPEMVCRVSQRILRPLFPFACTADTHQRTLEQHKRTRPHTTALSTCEVNCCL